MDNRCFLLDSIRTFENQKFEGQSVAHWQQGTNATLAPAEQKEGIKRSRGEITSQLIILVNQLAAKGRSHIVIGRECGIAASTVKRILDGVRMDTAKSEAVERRLQSIAVDDPAFAPADDLAGPPETTQKPQETPEIATTLAGPRQRIEPAREHHVLNWQKKMSNWEFTDMPDSVRRPKNRTNIKILTSSQANQILRPGGNSSFYDAMGLRNQQPTLINPVHDTRKPDTGNPFED